MLSPATRSSPSQPASWMRRLSRDRSRYVGIDIGIDRVRVAMFGVNHDAIKISPGKPSLEWLSRSEFQIPVDAQAPPPPDWVDIVLDSLTERLPRCVDGDPTFAVVALPIPWIHYQTAAATDIEASRVQCDSMFSTSLFASRAHVSNWPIAAGVDHWMIAATAESAACRIAESIASVGYHVQRIVPHGVALLDAAPALTTIKPSAVLLLELSGGLIALRTSSGPQSGRHCGLCRNLPACAAPSGDQPFLDELEPWLVEIASEVNATTRYMARLNDDVDTQSPLLVCGQAAQISGIDAALATLLGRPVAAWRYAGRMRPRREGPSGWDSAMAVSLSLAYCGTHRSCENKASIAARKSCEGSRS